MESWKLTKSHYSFTSLMGFVLEILFIYYAKPKAMQTQEVAQPEQRLAQNLNEAGLT